MGKNNTKPTLPQPNYWDLDRMFDNLKKDFEKTFSSFPTFSIPSMPNVSNMSCDLVDEGKQFVAKIDLPGIKKKDINLNVTENSIEVSAEHSKEEQEKQKNYLRKERSQLSYYRTIPLYDKVNANATKAKYADGVLTVILPKQNPAKPQRKKPVSVQ